MIIHALQTVLHFNKKYLSDVHITAYTITYSEYFLHKRSTRLQSMYNHMVGRAAAVISPFYSLLLGLIPTINCKSDGNYFIFTDCF